MVDTNDKIKFSYNDRPIKFGDATILGEFFSNEKNPLIFVNDRYNLLSNNTLTKMNIYFNDFGYSGKNRNYIINYRTTVEQAIKMYLYKIGDEVLIDSYYSKKNIYKLKFSYGNQSNIFGEQINIFGEQSNVENYFSGKNVRIQVSLK